MKITVRSIFYLFIGILAMQMFSGIGGCRPIPDEKCVETDECQGLRGESKVIPNQFVFYKLPEDSTGPYSYPIINGPGGEPIQVGISPHPDMLALIDTFNSRLHVMGADSVKPIYCPCDSSIFMIEDSNLQVVMDTLNNHASSEIGNESTGKNRVIPFNEIPPFRPLYSDQQSKTTGDSIIVGLVDTGIDFFQPKLQEILWENPTLSLTPQTSLACCDSDGYDFSKRYDLSNPDVVDSIKRGFLSIRPQDSLGHGTHIAGIIAHQRFEAQFKLLPVKISGGTKTNLFDAMCGTKYAANKEAKLINLSWGYYSKEPDSILYKLIKDAEENNVLFITSAGNDSINNDCCPHWPSNFSASQDMDNVISVAALNAPDQDQLAAYSNYGVQTVDIAATGSDVESFWVPTICKMASGTSMAAGAVTRNALHIKWDLMFLGQPSSPSIIKNSIISGASSFPLGSGKIRNEQKVLGSTDNCN